MSAAQLGEMIGGFIICFIILTLLMKWFEKSSLGYLTQLHIAAILTLSIATLAAGFGMADGGDPDFTKSFGIYALPALMAAGTKYFLDQRKSEQ